MSGVTVEVSARKITVPYLCPCCCGVADTALAVSFTRVTGKERVRETTRELDFPYCKRCVRHVRWGSSARKVAVLVMVGGAAAAIVTAVVLAPVLGVGIAVLAGIVATATGVALRARARAVCSPSCTGPGSAVTYHGWSDNVHRFSFVSRRYAAAFAEQNERSLVNVTPHLYQLIEQHRVEAAPKIVAESETESTSKPWPSASRLKAPTAPQPIVRVRTPSTPPQVTARPRAASTIPPPRSARSRASNSVPPPTHDAQLPPPTLVPVGPPLEPCPAEEEVVPLWPQRVDHGHGRALLENVIRLEVRSLQTGNVKRPGRVS
ncbi:MAG TPA: hypothetical protein VNO30_16115 [Kofleriaceae bacterium]|nr:hypothetical protein [Kofleriaceae bacterium]